MTIEETLTQLQRETKPTFSKAQVAVMLSNVDNTSLTVKATKPTKLKIGDVILMPAGLKVRPCVIIKVKKDVVHFVPLTTTEDHQVLMKCSSRFYGDTSFFTKGVLTTTHELAIKYFAGVYDKPSDIKKLITALSECFGFLQLSIK